MERSTSIYGSSSALRGVQLKIGESFKPPAKVTLPVGWKTRDPSRLLSFSYDFTLEEEVITKIKAEREAREKHEQAQKIKELQKKTSTANPAVANMGADILQPTTATTTTMTASNLSNENKQFNYKDFEDNTDTPFEAVELQCINNMEALKSVLQPDVETDSVTCDSGPQIPPRTNNTSSVPISTSGIPINETANPFDACSLETNFPMSSSPVQVTPINSYPPMYAGDSIHTHMGQNISQDTFGTQNGGQGPVSTGAATVSPQLNADSYSTGVNVSGTDRKISLPGALRVLPEMPFRPPPRRPISAPGGNITPEMMPAFGSQSEAPSPSPRQKRPVPKPRSKLPPLRNELEDGPSQEPLYDLPPPPLPPKISIGKTRNMDHAPNPDVPKDDANLKRFPTPLPPISPPKQEITPPLNDPRSTMSGEEIQFVNQISAMGFPVGRVARAVKNLGCKEREVIDFLISVNDMCTLGYSEDQVEMVLKDNNDQTKAKEFLKLIVQFKEFGFREDRIFDALKKTECDGDKALDILTCAG